MLFACQLGRKKTQYQETAPDQLILGHYLNGGVFCEQDWRCLTGLITILREEAVTIPLVFWDFVMLLLLFKLTKKKKIN